MCSKKTQIIKIKYFDEDLPRLNKIEKGDWIDLYSRCVEYGSIDSNSEVSEWSKEYCGLMHIQQGDIVRVKLGVAMELPIGYEAYVLPRSSTFNKKGLVLTNSMGVLDESYRGDSDEWMSVWYATRNTTLDFAERLLQFRIIEHQPPVVFTEVASLGNEARGGYGTTGI